MFAGKTKTKDKRGGRRPPSRARFDNEPPQAGDALVDQRYYEQYGAPRVEAARFFVSFIVVTLVVGMLGAAIYRMLPLKTAVVHVVEVSKEEGRVLSTQVLAEERYSPGAAQKKYFVVKWVRELLTIDKGVTEKNLRVAYATTRNAAIQEITEWIRREAPIARLQSDPTLTRTVSISSASLPREDIVLVRATTVERTALNPAAKEKKLVITVHILVIPPEDEARIIENPLGIYISHFEINEDLEK